MLEPADIGDLDDLPELWRLHGSRIGTVHVQRSVHTPAMVVLKVAGQDALQVTLVQDDDVVKALSPDGADQALDVGVCGHVEMHHSASVMGEDQKDEQDLETDGRDSEEIDGDQVLEVIIQERPPVR